jgi:hypothetical protein
MIAVVASSYDRHALRIVENWGFDCAMILSAEDLCRPGWLLRVPLGPSGTAVIGGRTVRAEQIHGILTLRPCVFPEELQDIQSVHRKYVAAELNAFLLTWLTAQTCTVINRPTPCCLSGPGWGPEQWARAAAQMGIPAQIRRQVPNAEAIPIAQEALEVVAIGENCFGFVDSILRERTLKLAKAASVDLLSVRFTADEGRFLSANVWPSLSDPAVLDAVRRRLENKK